MLYFPARWHNIELFGKYRTIWKIKHCYVHNLLLLLVPNTCKLHSLDVLKHTDKHAVLLVLRPKVYHVQ